MRSHACDAELVASAEVTIVNGMIIAQATEASANDSLSPLALDGVIALETLVHTSSVREAYCAYERATAAAPPNWLTEQIAALVGESSHLRITLAHRRCLLEVGSNEPLDVTEWSRGTHQVARAIARVRGLDVTPDAPESFDTFVARVAELRRVGLVAPAVGSLDWGDLRCSRPVCGFFGTTRGEPVDRYYLAQFLDAVRHEIHGDVLDIGGERSNRDLYRLCRINRYVTLALSSDEVADVIGDATDESLIPAASLDSVLLFNVLEHCVEPWKVVETVRTWLRPDGKVFCMVPNAQRLHGYPRDYWRPLPDAVHWMFRGFAEPRLFVYGNPTTVVASLLGIAAEELRPDELDAFHPDFPVATCLVARAAASADVASRL